MITGGQYSASYPGFFSRRGGRPAQGPCAAIKISCKPWRIINASHSFEPHAHPGTWPDYRDIDGMLVGNFLQITIVQIYGD